MVYIFLLRLTERTIFGLAGEGDSTPICLLPPSSATEICPLGCLFLQVVFQHIGYFISLVSQPCLIWTISWGFRYVLEGPLVDKCLWHSWRVLISFRKSFQSFLRDMDCFSNRMSLGFSALVVRSSSVWMLLWRFFCGTFLYLITRFYRGVSEVLGRTDLLCK